MVNIENLTKEQIENLKFTDIEKKELEKARKMTVIFDEDCPETTPERALKFKRVNPRRGAINRMAQSDLHSLCIHINMINKEVAPEPPFYRCFTVLKMKRDCSSPVSRSGR